MFTSKTGSCLFRGPPGLATPYLAPRLACFQPAFETAPIPDGCGCCPDQQNTRGQGGELNCYRNWSTRGSCYYNPECSSIGGRCSSGQCGAFQSNNARVVKRMSWEEMAQFAQASGVPMPKDTFGQEMLMVEQPGPGGRPERFVVTPLTSTYRNSNEPQCSTCLKTVWQCDRFQATGDLKKYQQCKAMESCFLYDVQQADGSLLPVVVKNTPECMGCAKAALQKCAVNCAQCQPNDGLATDTGGLFGRS